ncbi:MAG: hypothetical protein NTV14_00445 [Coprothermobacterota bacterium]|nr:hypothetical protein [Coprothermobacterota bacterium]
MAAEMSGTMERKFGDPDFQAYFSRFYSEFSALYAEFQGKSTVYGDFWQFVLAKAAREMGILDPGEDRRLTDIEVRDLYNRVLAAMPKQEELAPTEEEAEARLEEPIRPLRFGRHLAGERGGPFHAGILPAASFQIHGPLPAGKIGPRADRGI